MSGNDIQPLVLRELGIRIGPAMADYVARQRSTAPAAPIPVIGGDARTGIPVRKLLDPAALRSESATS